MGNNEVEQKAGVETEARAEIEARTGAVRNFKDTMFRLLFKDKGNLLSLYNAVNDTHYENADELEIVTLENAVFMNMKNDLAFLMDFYLNIYEHQSTTCPNMPLRDLFYVSKEYSKLVNTEKLYGSKRVKIPTPQFYVFYNGEKNAPESQLLCLSDAFEQPTDQPELELKVRMLNINTGKNKKLLDRCRALHEYMLFVEKVRKYSKTIELEDAIHRTVDECIAEGILREFLMKHKQEAIEVCIFEYNEEKALGYIRQDEYDRGKEDGQQKKLVELVCRKLIKGRTVSEIADALEEDETVVQTICDVAGKYAPDYDAEKILEELL